ncbi:MAG: exonuclease domain-containing protein [Pseudomonadota bacterium]
MTAVAAAASIDDVNTCTQIVDVETTGVEDDARVVEIGAIFLRELADGSLWIERAQSHLVDPGMPIPATASAVHHITDDMVRGKSSLATTIFDGGYRWGDYHVAHNAAFDRRFLGADSGLPEQVALDNPWICTYKCAYVQWPDAPSYGNQALSYWLSTQRPPDDCGHAHRALYDCHTTMGILIALRAHGWTWQRMAEVTAEPLILRSFSFGKHAGVPISDVPFSYLQWMGRQSDWDSDVAATLAHELDRRQRR